MRHIVVDARDNNAHGFDTLRAVLDQRDDVQAVVIPNLEHVAHIDQVAGLTPAELGRHLGVAVRIIDPDPPTPPVRDVPRRPAVGLVHRPTGTPAADRTWARALIVRHARDTGLALRDILELDDNPATTDAVLARLSQHSTDHGVRVLLTDGLDPDLARRLATDLGLEHLLLPNAARPSWVT